MAKFLLIVWMLIGVIGRISTGETFNLSGVDWLVALVLSVLTIERAVRDIGEKI